jgi:arsenate reductase-like glutaredoxin family protein
MLIELSKFLQSEDFKRFMVEFATNMFILGNMIGYQTKLIVSNFQAISLSVRMTKNLLLLDVTDIIRMFSEMSNKSKDATKGLTAEQKGFISWLETLKTGAFAIGEDVAVDPAPLEQRIKDAADKIKGAATKFRDSVAFSMGLSEDSKFFNADLFMNKMRDVLTAAKKLPAKLAELRKAGASKEMLQEIISQGPQAGLAIAEGFLRTGTTKEYVNTANQLSKIGGRTMANAAGQATYNINVNKANMTAEEIIAAIQKYEKKTGRKVTF